MEFVSIDPTTEDLLERWPVHTAVQREELLDAAAAAARGWRATPIDERGRLLHVVGATLRERRQELALLATTEMGKPVAEALAEVDKCASACAWFADNAAAMVADEPHPSGASESYVSFRPLGVIFAIMPWNFPYWQVFRHAAPALMAGNVVVVKHAETTLGCAHALASVFADAGAATGLLSVLVCTIEDAAAVIQDSRVAAVTLTGSTRAGASVAATAGAALKKTVLELGGSDAFVVLDDADVAAAAATAVRARFQNTGQSCIAAKRFVVLPSVADAFTEAFISGVRALVVGDPREDGTTLGPLARADLRAVLARQVEESVASGGAQLLLKGGRQDGRGFFYRPAVLRVHDTSVPVWREEVFGPAAPIVVARDEEHALAIVNDSDYGLGGNVWTGDVERGKAFAARVESGAVFVNGMTASDPRLPFGGMKRSGYGRELSAFGLREFVNVQTVWVGPAQQQLAPAAE